MLFMRHGQSMFNVVCDATGRDPNLPDAPLSALGVRQVQEAASRLNLTIEGIVSSPYTRALQTASIVAAVLKVPVRVDPLAGERRIYSCDVGTPASRLKQDWPSLDFSGMDEEWWLPFPESQRDLERRVRLFLARWEAEPQEKNLLVVSHWYFINAATGAYLGNAEVREG